MVPTILGPYRPALARDRLHRRAVPLFDLGPSIFDGTSREPSLRPVFRVESDPDGNPIPVPRETLAPYYVQIRQFGLDAQLTAESLLLELEAIHQ